MHDVSRRQAAWIIEMPRVPGTGRHRGGAASLACPLHPPLRSKSPLVAEPPVDTEGPDNVISESPEATLERTKQLLARSRATLEVVSHRLKSREASHEPPISPAGEPPG